MPRGSLQFTDPRLEVSTSWPRTTETRSIDSNGTNRRRGRRRNRMPSTPTSIRSGSESVNHATAARQVIVQKANCKASRRPSPSMFQYGSLTHPPIQSPITPPNVDAPVRNKATIPTNTPGPRATAAVYTVHRGALAGPEPDRRRGVRPSRRRRSQSQAGRRREARARQWGVAKHAVPVCTAPIAMVVVLPVVVSPTDSWSKSPSRLSRHPAAEAAQRRAG